MNIGGGIHIGNEIRIRVRPEIETYSSAKMKILGDHSIENMMAAICAARDYGAQPVVIQRVIDSFKSLSHRLEYVRKVGGVCFYNDSKSTNVHAITKALSAFDENVILICGGKDANLSFDSLAKIVKEKVKNADSLWRI